jgi:hypothetical protein
MSDMEIWDGADLSLLREHLAELVDTNNEKRIGVDMTFVKYVPSGFFGMLYDYTERGVTMRVYNPLTHVRAMLWFREFFDDIGDGVFRLVLRQQTSMSSGESRVGTRAPWSTDEVVSHVESVTERRDHAVVVP